MKKMVMDKSALYPDNKDVNDYLMSLYPKKIFKTQTLKTDTKNENSQ